MRNILFFSILILALYALPAAAELDPDLAAKADGFQTYLEEWHAAPIKDYTGALTGGVTYTDGARQEIACLNHQGDSTIWTGMYLGSQALRYRVTGDEDARAEALRVAAYLHDAMDITQTLGYVARFAGLDEAPWNCGYGDEHEWKVKGEGDWAGHYWVDHTSRDQYNGWWFGLSLAYDLVDDEPMRAQIREDFADVIEMLVTNGWNITDENGEYTGNNAAWVGPTTRLSWLAMTGHVTGDDYYWNLLDEQWRENHWMLWFDLWAGFNKYDEYFGNNLRHLQAYNFFRLLPDRRRMADYWEMWMSANRPYVEFTHNPWFDAVHVAGCKRLGVCDSDELAAIIVDYKNTLDRYWAPPAYQREVTCSEQPVDPLSETLHQIIIDNPWLGDLINIDLQVAEARELNDRHWTDMYWQSTPFEWSCYTGENQAYTGPGMDYLLAFWIGAYYALLPNDGEVFDAPLLEDDEVFCADVEDCGLADELGIAPGDEACYGYFATLDADTADCVLDAPDCEAILVCLPVADDDVDDDAVDDDAADDDFDDDAADDDSDDDLLDDDADDDGAPDAGGDDDDDDDGACCG